MHDLSNLTAKSLTYGSMQATNTVSQIVAFQPPGSLSEAVTDTDIRPELPDLPPLAPKFTAGPGDRGGFVVGEGTSPSAGWNDTWTMAGHAGHDRAGGWSPHNTPDAPDPGH